MDKDAQSKGSHWQNPVTGNDWANLTSPEDWETEDGGWQENLCIMGFLVHHNLAALWDCRRKDAEALLKVSIHSSVSLKTINTKLTHAVHYALLLRTQRPWWDFIIRI